MSFPTAQQFSAVHTLVGPSGYRAVFNDPLDVDYAGALIGEDAVTGLDSADIRSSLYDLVQADGAVAGPFFSGTRPITMQPTYHGATIVDRNRIESRIRKVLNSCLTADGTLTWNPAGSVSQFVSVRFHQPFRSKGVGMHKTGMFGLVAPNPLILSTAGQTASQEANTDLTVTNEGEVYSPPVLLRINGPGTAPSLLNVTTGRTLAFTSPSLVLAAGQYVDVNVLNGTAVRNDGTSVYDNINFPSQADWWTLAPGANVVRLNWGSGSTSDSDLRVDWRYAWK